MTGSTSFFSSLLAATALAGCVEHESLPRETTSLEVTVTAPTDLGAADRRLGQPVSEVTIAVRALDERGGLASTFSGPVDVYVHSLSVLEDGKAELVLQNGQGGGTFALPVTYGPTFLWLEDGTGAAPSYAAGVSPTLWFREPYLDDVQRPDLGNPSTWLRHSPLEGKQVKIAASRFGASGRLVVTGVYSSGFTFSDVDCTSLPCQPSPYAHGFAFSSSRPIDITGHPLAVGQTLVYVDGGVSEFYGFTEINFPTMQIKDFQKDESLVPDPVVLQKAWLGDPLSPDGQIHLEEVESALVAVDGATVCPLDRDYQQYQEWKLDLGAGCQNPIYVITAGQVVGFDPASAVGKKLKRVEGTLKSLSALWILQPRRLADIVVN